MATKAASHDLLQRTAWPLLLVTVGQSLGLALAPPALWLAAGLFAPWWPVQSGWTRFISLCLRTAVSLGCHVYEARPPALLAAACFCVAVGSIEEGPRAAAGSALTAALVLVWTAALATTSTYVGLYATEAWTAVGLVAASWADLYVLQPLVSRVLPDREDAPLLAAWFTVPWLVAVLGSRSLAVVSAVLALAPASWVPTLGLRIDTAVWAASAAGVTLAQSGRFDPPAYAVRVALCWAVACVAVLRDAVDDQPRAPRARLAPPLRVYPVILQHTVALSIVYMVYASP